MGQEKLTKVDSIDSDIEKGTVVEEVTPSRGKVGPPTQQSRRKLDLDTGEEHVRFRRKWWQLWSVYIHAKTTQLAQSLVNPCAAQAPQGPTSPASFFLRRRDCHSSCQVPLPGYTHLHMDQSPDGPLLCNISLP